MRPFGGGTASSDTIELLTSSPGNRPLRKRSLSGEEVVDVGAQAKASENQGGERSDQHGLHRERRDSRARQEKQTDREHESPGHALREAARARRRAQQGSALWLCHKEIVD